MREDMERATGRLAKNLSRLELLEKKIAYSDLFMQAKVRRDNKWFDDERPRNQQSQGRWQGVTPVIKLRGPLKITGAPEDFQKDSIELHEALGVL